VIDRLKRYICLRYLDRVIMAEMERYVVLGAETTREVSRGAEFRIDTLKNAIEIVKVTEL
jgi:hypothetical protein